MGPVRKPDEIYKLACALRPYFEFRVVSPCGVCGGGGVVGTVSSWALGAFHVQHCTFQTRTFGFLHLHNALQRSNQARTVHRAVAPALEITSITL
jgi:hypothetical protein